MNYDALKVGARVRTNFFLARITVNLAQTSFWFGERFNTASKYFTNKAEKALNDRKK